MQTEGNWKLTVCSNADDSLLAVRDKLGGIVGGDERIDFRVTETNTEFWGAKNRREFIKTVEDGVMIVNTSSEDYYAPKTVEYINLTMRVAHMREAIETKKIVIRGDRAMWCGGEIQLQDNTNVEFYLAFASKDPRMEKFWNQIVEDTPNTKYYDFIYWDFSHHHFDYNTNFAIVQPRLRKIDWGSYAILSDVAKTIDLDSIPALDPRGEFLRDEKGEVVMINGWEQFMGDGFFVERVFKQHEDLKHVRLPKVLFVKN